MHHLSSISLLEFQPNAFRRLQRPAHALTPGPPTRTANTCAARTSEPTPTPTRSPSTLLRWRRRQPLLWLYGENRGTGRGARTREGGDGGFFMPLPTTRQRNYPTDRLTCWPGTSCDPGEGGLRSAAGPPTPAALLASDHLHSLSPPGFFFS